MISKEQIYTFIYFGYLPQPKQVNLKGLLSRYQINLKPAKNLKPIKETVNEGSAILDQIFSEVAKKLGRQSAVIPISGGMDSRAILGGMLNYLSKQQINTVTVGIQGSLDFEIGKKITKKFGIRNRAINLDFLSYKESDLLQYSKNFNFPINLLEGYLFYQIFSEISFETHVISGFMGDPLSGSHLPSSVSSDWEKAVTNFMKKNKKVDFTIESNFIRSFPQKPFIDSSFLNFDEQLDFFIRQRMYIKPLVLFKKFKHLTPFLDPRWIEFNLNLPFEYRKNQYIYKKILLNLYPGLFSLPLKNENGLGLNAPFVKKYLLKINKKISSFQNKYLTFFNCNPSIRYLNYINYAETLRTKRDLRELVEKNLKELKNRNLLGEIDIMKIWKEHQTQVNDNSILISRLFSLEIFLKSQGNV